MATPRYGFVTPVQQDASDAPAQLLQFAQQVEQALGQHEDATVAHGRSSALVAVNDSQTLTGKTILGSENTLRPRMQDLDRAILWKQGDSGSTINPGDVKHPTFNNIAIVSIAASGGWDVSGGHSAQWSFPVAGLYRVSLAYEFSRTNVNQSGQVTLQLRSGMAANDAGSGTIYRLYEFGWPSGQVGTVQLHTPVVVTSTSQVWGAVVGNSTSHAIVAEVLARNPRDIFIEYLGPAT